MHTFGEKTFVKSNAQVSCHYNQFFDSIITNPIIHFFFATKMGDFSTYHGALIRAIQEGDYLTAKALIKGAPAVPDIEKLRGLFTSFFESRNPYNLEDPKRLKILKRFAKHYFSILHPVLWDLTTVEQILQALRTKMRAPLSYEIGRIVLKCELERNRQHAILFAWALLDKANWEEFGDEIIVLPNAGAYAGRSNDHRVFFNALMKKHEIQTNFAQKRAVVNREEEEEEAMLRCKFSLKKRQLDEEEKNELQKI